MKFHIPAAWCENMARKEMGMEIGVGLLAIDPFFLEEKPARDNTCGDDSIIPLNRFVHLMRRNKGLTLEQLANQADIDLADLLNIEEDAHYLPEVRAIYNLSKVFNVSQKKMMGLSGLTKPKNKEYIEEAVRYAARSASIEQLSAEEQAALEGFISVLSEK